MRGPTCSFWAKLTPFSLKLEPNPHIPGAMETLYARALAVGLDTEHGGVFDQIHRVDGSVLKPTKRLWPQVELGFGRIVTLCFHSSTLYKIR